MYFGCVLRGRVMLEHFRTNIREKMDGMRLNRNNYADISKFKTRPTYYTDSIIDNTKMLALLNFDLNINYFKNLDSFEFKRVIEDFTFKSSFQEITNLAEYSGVSGYYLLVLDKYSQAYLGISKDIKKRVMSHWSRQVGLDRLVFGDTKTSKISVDSFKVLDTTRIFIKEDSNPERDEDSYIDLIPGEFCLNRTKGGKLNGGLAEAIANKKSNYISISDDNQDVYAEIKRLLDKRKILMDIAFESRKFATNYAERSGIKRIARNRRADYRKDKVDNLKNLYLFLVVIVIVLGSIILFSS